MIQWIEIMIIWFLEELLVMLSFICVGILLHELAHFIDAKFENNYKGWGLLPTPHVKLFHPFSSRWKYLNGFLFSMVLEPLWILVFGLDLWFVYFLMMLGASSADFLCCAFYGRLKQAG